MLLIYLIVLLITLANRKVSYQDNDRPALNI